MDEANLYDDDDEPYFENNTDLFMILGFSFKQEKTLCCYIP